MRDLNLRPEYSTSHALVIGIDNYQKFAPLQNAANDATALADLLEHRFDFPKDNITLLINEVATRARVLSAYFAYERKTDADSRLIVFFAGHGHTRTGKIREVGFLIPQDGSPDDLSTLIRWEELTGSVDLIPAKHVLFIMDACYGGLVFNRAVAAGSVRFLKDMMLRPVRQALTAGKEDEPVADAGGPRPQHSIFTGHLLNGLTGEANAPEGHLTASGLMSYVHKQVANDIHSEQTPHYGFLSGDGDFIFAAPDLAKIATSETGELDKLITVASLEIPESAENPEDPFATAKRYLSDSTHAIPLHDLVMHHVRKVIIETPKERFPVQGVQFSVEEFTRRLHFCEATTQDLRRILACISYWGGETVRSIITKALARVTDHLEAESGLTIWNSLRWYPTLLLCYSSGIAALANANYRNLAALFMTPITSPRNAFEHVQLAPAIGDEIVALERSNAFTMLPGHERYRVPRSEYLYKFLQPELDDDLFLGKGYEVLFDRFEVFLALANATIRKKNEDHIWGPVGRFGWKSSGSSSGENPLRDVIKEANDQGPDWPAFSAGIFGRDHALFLAAADEFRQKVVGLGWW